MAAENLPSREAFLAQAKELGLAADSSHMEELYLNVQSVLAGLQILYEIDVAGAEPDMAFMPPQG